MIKLSKELIQRFEEAGKDAAWVEKLHTATTWEEYEKLLGEKDIEASAELKDAFTASLPRKTGELADDELEKVSGGEYNLSVCLKYNSQWCPFCPHYKKTRKDSIVILPYCDLGYWDAYDEFREHF